MKAKILKTDFAGVAIMLLTACTSTYFLLNDTAHVLLCKLMCENDFCVFSHKNTLLVWGVSCPNQ